MITTGRSPISGKLIDIYAENGRIREIRAASQPDDGTAPWVAPGFVDIQVNGFAGVDYNSPETPAEDIARSIDVQRSTGVSRLLPTVITGSAENMTGALANMVRAQREIPNADSIVGYHVEGPWIAAEDGPRGAHPKEHVRAPSMDEFERFQEATEGQVRILTLAPEHEGALEVIEKIAEQGVVVAIGHTAATVGQIRDAVSAGATMSTHLGNGSHRMIARHDNYITAQMAADELWAGLIVDGIHLPPSLVKVAVRAKGRERCILTTDAAPPACGDPGVYRLGHVSVELSADGTVMLEGTDQLAGSGLSLDKGVGNLVRFAGLTLLDALKLATANPAQSIQLEGRRGFLAPGDAADLALFAYDEQTAEVRVQELRMGLLD